ncbi:hypothetical protein COU74_02835 [Candidatus Peregrinibacteria bacterium CG10_big_fil_rev_8_21_14_0_10_36_19]|nr:MAG: hypothetical protein COU74_02835 [Candidatus Peregrinibacteria bacterium CG10_big_fil_rev_8_21_14_0_10_36_19]
MAKNNVLKCVFTGQDVATVGSIEDAVRGEADGVSTNVGIIHKNLIGVYEYVAGSVLSADPKVQREEIRSKMLAVIPLEEAA